MILLTFLLGLISHTLAQYVGVSGLFFGPAYTVVPTSSVSIVGYSCVLTVPKVPSSLKGLLVIWPGINTPGDPTNLVQSFIGVGSSKTACPTAKADQWCAVTSTNVGASPRTRNPGRQKEGRGIGVSPGKELHFLYTYDDQTQLFNQKLTLDDKVISTRSDKVGKGARFNTAVEGQGAFSGVIYSHTYRNNTFKFASAYPKFASSVRKGKGITASTPVSSDGGKTWTVDQIVIPDYSKGKGKAKRRT